MQNIAALAPNLPLTGGRNAPGLTSADHFNGLVERHHVTAEVTAP